ncbi:DUF4465 domain-containing protein [bacterium]|nr:DUF4465 domain-containing protein [bacterium]
MRIPFILSAFLLLASSLSIHAAPIDFEDVPLAPNSFYNGSDNTGGFTSGTGFFNNTYTDFGGGFTGWTGWSVSSVTDPTTPGFGNQYAAYPGSGSGGSSNYGVLFASPWDEAFITFSGGELLKSIDISNTTYAALSMKDGDAFAKKFGGITGNDPDYFGWTITGTDASNQVIGSIDVYLADYRFANNSLDYIVSQWITVDLSTLANAVRLDFTPFSSDIGQFGINTPTYLAADNVVFVPEVSTLALCGVGSLISLALVLKRNSLASRSRS